MDNQIRPQDKLWEKKQHFEWVLKMKGSVYVPGLYRASPQRILVVLNINSLLNKGCVMGHIFNDCPKEHTLLTCKNILQEKDWYHCKANSVLKHSYPVR